MGAEGHHYCLAWYLLQGKINEGSIDNKKLIPSDKISVLVRLSTAVLTHHNQDIFLLTGKKREREREPGHSHNQIKAKLNFNSIKRSMLDTWESL